MKDLNTIRSSIKIVTILLVPSLSLATDSTSLFTLAPSRTATPPQYYSTPITLGSGITNENYQTLPLCGNINLAYCPDINGHYPSLPSGVTQTQVTTTYCPAVCQLSRTTSGSGWTVTTVDAVCPQGYTSVAQFNMQPEYIYYSTPTNIFPITSMASYNLYTSSGASCAPSGPQNSWTTSCGGSQQFNNNQVLDNMPNASGKVVQITKVDQFCYLTGSSCNISKAMGCTGAYDSEYKFTYQQIGCTLFGMFPTGNPVPTTQICARVAATWKQNN